MSRRTQAVAVAATAGGGVLTAAFLQAAVAVAAPETGSDEGFTVGPLTFTDPVALHDIPSGPPTPGYESLFPLFSNAPLLAIGTDHPLIVSTGSQQFTVEDSSGTTLGTVDTQVNDQNLLGIQTAQFTVASTDPATGLTSSQTAELPADGTVYSITKLGSGFANVYEAVPNADGTAASKITDTLVTPFGNVNVPTSYDAIAPLDPAAALKPFAATSSNPDLSANAFTINGTTFDPGSSGFSAPVFDDGNVFSVAPLLHFGASNLNLPGAALPTPSQDFAVYSNGTDDGTVHSSWFDSNLLGIDSTQLTVNGVTPTEAAVQSGLAGLDYTGADFTAQDLATALLAKSTSSNFLGFGTGDITAGQVQSALFGSGINLTGTEITNADIASALNNVSVADLPAIGTVYSVTDLGSGFENVYEAVPGTSGGAATITDHLVTPFGNLNVPTSYDATAQMNPAAPLGALAATSSNAADLSDHAFTIDGTTFDPGADGFRTVFATFGIAPLLEIAGSQLHTTATFPFVTQDDVAIYDSSGTDLGTVNLGENLSNILGIDTSQFTVSKVDAATDLTASQTAELPAVGTVYSVTDLGGGFENVYVAIPNAAGTVASKITDTLMTPFGTVDLSSLFGMFDAIAPLDPGDAAAGVDAGTAAAGTAAEGFDLFNPSTWF